MSTSKNSTVQKGWIRVILFFAVFLGVFVLANLAYQQTGSGSRIPLIYANSILLAVTALVVVVPFRKYVDKKTVLSLGFNLRGATSTAMMGLLFPAVILGIGSLLLYANRNIDYHEVFYPGTDLLTGFGLMAVIAVAEEFVFRGYILNNLLSSFNKWSALVISAILFAFIHSANPNVSFIAIINVFLAGILIGLPYVFTRNLWFSICFHFSWNFLQGPVLGYEVSGLRLESVVKATISGNSFITGGHFGFEGSVIQTIMFIIIIPILLRYFAPGIADIGGVQRDSNKNPGEHIGPPGNV